MQGLDAELWPFGLGNTNGIDHIKNKDCFAQEARGEYCTAA